MPYTTESLNKETRATIYKIAREVAKVNNLSGYHHFKKAQLIDLIIKYDVNCTLEPLAEPINAGELLEAAQRHNEAKETKVKTVKKVKADEVLSFADAVKLVQAQGYDTIAVNVDEFKVYLLSGSNQVTFLLPRDAVAYASANPIVKSSIKTVVEPELKGQFSELSCDVLEGYAGQSCELPTKLSAKVQNELHMKNLDKAMISHKRYGISRGRVDTMSFSVEIYFGKVKLGTVGCNVHGEHWFTYAYAPKISTKVDSFDVAVTYLVKRLPKSKTVA